MEVLEGHVTPATPSSPVPPSPRPPTSLLHIGGQSPSTDSVPQELVSKGGSPAARSPSLPLVRTPAASPAIVPNSINNNNDSQCYSTDCQPLEQCMEQASLSSPGSCSRAEGSCPGGGPAYQNLEDVPMQSEESNKADLDKDDPLGGTEDIPVDESSRHDGYERDGGPAEYLDQEQVNSRLSESDHSHLSEGPLEDSHHQQQQQQQQQPPQLPQDASLGEIPEAHSNIEASSSSEEQRTLSDQSPLLNNEIQQRNLLNNSRSNPLQDASLLSENPSHRLQQQNAHQYGDQHLHMQEYQHQLGKMSQMQDSHGHLQREGLSHPPLHAYDPDRLQPQQQHLHQHHHHHHQHMVGGNDAGGPHLEDPLNEHSRHQLPDRSHEPYWNLHLGMLSKVKTESKDWFDDPESMTPDSMSSLSGALKSESHQDPYSNYRLPPHHPGLGPEGSLMASLNGPRPSPLSHGGGGGGGLPFSQSPDQRHQQHYQPYQSHPGMRDMSPMSPNYQGHTRPPHHVQQHPGVQHHTSQHPGLQHSGAHHGGGQHLQQQQYPGQQYGNQPPLGLQGHHGQPYHQSLGGHLGPGMGGHVHEGREGREGDPYSFVDEYTGPPPRPVEEILGHTQPKRRGRKPKHIKLMENGGDPVAIAAAQAAHEAKKRKWRQMGPDGKPLPIVVKARKRLDRFDGIPEDELTKKTLPDHLGPNLDIVIISKFPFQIGINPGLFAAYKGHHYAGPGNHFWKCLFLSGLIPEPLTSDDDSQLLEHGIGFTNIVARTTRGSAELTRKEIKEGGQILLSKLQRYQPRVAVFNGKGIYEIFSGKKEFTFGRQPEKIEGTQTHVWVMPSSSARCAQLPRALDKVPFYTALRKFRDYLKGTLTELTEEEVTFTSQKSKHYKLDYEKLERTLGEELSDPFIEDAIKEDPDASRFESDLDSDEIHRSITQSLYNLAGITREQLEAMDCPTIPIRKKRGRPKKTPEDPNIPSRPKPRPLPTELMLCNGEEPPRKKRGRPKKILEDGTIPPPKKPGRKPKALKEMLASQQAMGQGNVHQNTHHQQMTINHMNGIMSPSGGYNSPPVGAPFSPHYGNSQSSVHSMGGAGHSLPGDRLPSMHSGLNPNSVHSMSSPQLSNNSNSLLGNGRPLAHSGKPAQNLSSLQSGSVNGPIQPPGCTTPNSSSGHGTPVHGSMPPRGHTPQNYGQSPGYSPSPASGVHSSISAAYGNASEKSDLHLEDEHQFGLSPPPSSPVLGQPDFEPPTSLPDSEPILGGNEAPNLRPVSTNQVEEMGLLDRQQHTPSLQSQLSNPSTPADESATPYQNYSSYQGTKSCSPSYNSNVTPSPSYPQSLSHSPSYPHNVSCSPSYTPHNTHSPSYPPNPTQSPSYHANLSQSPSYPPNSTQSPSYPHNSNPSSAFPPSVSRSPSYPTPNQAQSPSFTPATTQSPSYPTNNTQSPSYHTNITHSPSYSAITKSPSYPSSLTHSPSYPNSTNTQSPSYRPPTSQSPSFSSGSTHSPLNKPLVPGVHSPQLSKSDVSSKSLSGLESLVDQIPSLNEVESTGGPHSAHSTTGPCSNPTTPGPVTGPAQFSPGHNSAQGSFQNFSANGGGSFSHPHYGSPQSSHPYSPHYSSSSTNLSTNFSVSSLANSSLTTSLSYSSGYEVDHTSSTTTTSSSTTLVSSSNGSSFSVSSLTGGSPTPTPNMYNSHNNNSNSSSNSYSPAPPGPPYSEIMGSSILPPTPPMSSSFMGSPSLMGASSSMPTSMGSSTMSSFHSSMNMSGSQLPYPYSQYGDAAPAYTGPSHSSFPYPSSSPNFHVPSPRFPYPSPYSGVSYSQGYSQNAMLERIKQTGMGMGMGFGGF